jgi:hypothetical protein
VPFLAWWIPGYFEKGVFKNLPLFLNPEKKFQTIFNAMASANDRIDMLERQNKKLTQALQGIATLLQEVLKAPEIPAKIKWNPILNKIKAGLRISTEEYNTINELLDHDKYEDNQLFNEAITVALRGMMAKHIKTQLHVPLVKSKNITISEALKHIQKISEMQNDDDLLKYLSSDEFLTWLANK